MPRPRPRPKVALFYIINGIMDIDEGERVYKHMSQREIVRLYNYVKGIFDFISPVRLYCDLLSFYKYDVQVLICFFNPFRHVAHLFFEATPSAERPFGLFLENYTPEEVHEVMYFLDVHGYGDVKIYDTNDYLIAINEVVL